MVFKILVLGKLVLLAEAFFLLLQDNILFSLFFALFVKILPDFVERLPHKLSLFLQTYPYTLYYVHRLIHHHDSDKSKSDRESCPVQIEYHQEEEEEEESRASAAA